MAISKEDAAIRKQIAESYKQQQELEKIHMANLHAASTAEEKIAAALDVQADKLRMINELKEHYNSLSRPQKKQLAELTAEYNEQVRQLKILNEQVKLQAKHQDAVNKKVERYSNLLAKGWEYLMQSDKVIKETIRNLGMSGTKAEDMRKSFEYSAGHVARMGGSLADIQTIMSGYADETGRARVLSSQMAEDIAAIGLGTGLGIEQAAKLGAQFEIMGLDARRTNEFVQGIVDTSERMGVNTTKVLKGINDNFKKINTYNFKAGSEGIAKMAMDAEKFKVSISTALDAAEATRTLEGAIEAVANLQVMGGEFAKLDMFSTLYMSRNEPEKWNQEISNMTRGMVTFKKNSEGVFEKFISPADRQRLEYAAKALGISKEEITEISQRRAELDLMASQLAGTGLTEREKELVEGAAIFNTKSAKFEVQLAGRMRDITTLTSEQAKSFAKEQSALKDRAEAAQDFETALKATIEELKASLLPILRGVNAVLAVIRPIAKGFNDIISWFSKHDIGRGIAYGAGILMSAGFLLNTVLKGFTSRGLSERIATRLAGGATEKTGGFSARNLFRKKAPTGGIVGGGAGKAISGKAMAGAGAGIGAAALGVGAGIGAAAAGISLLANAMNKLDEEKAKILQNIVITLGAIMVVGMGAAVGVAALGASSTAVAPGLAIFGATVLMIGAGIGLATAGIGVLAMGFSNLFDSMKGSGDEIGKVATGMLKMAGAMALFSVGGLGLPVFMAAMGSITVASLASAKMASNLERMGTAMSGTKDDWIAVQNAITAISSANFKGGGMLADLANLLKKPLKVEFADKKLQVVSDITLNIDGEKFMQRVYRPNTALVRHNEAKNGQSAG